MSTRTFIAIELNEALRVALMQQIEELRRILPSLPVRWVDATNLHLTLAFLGDLNDDELAHAIAAARAAASQCVPFELHLGNLGFFGSPAAPRVIWVGVEGDSTALQALQKNLAGKLTAQQLSLSDHSFSPHLTVARVKLPVSNAAVQQLAQYLSVAPSNVQDKPSLTVDHIAVMKSELVQPAARYTCLQRCSFGS